MYLDADITNERAIIPGLFSLLSISDKSHLYNTIDRIVSEVVYPLKRLLDVSNYI